MANSNIMNLNRLIEWHKEGLDMGSHSIIIDLSKNLNTYLKSKNCNIIHFNIIKNQVFLEKQSIGEALEVLRCSMIKSMGIG